jgi:hypothetical protein
MPVDVIRIATAKGIQITEDLEGAKCEEGRLMATKAGFRIRLRHTSTESRRRLSLAHELGHTLFYLHDGNGPRHAIGVLDRAEISAEERVCNAFARALLMPARLCQTLIPPLEDSAALFDSLESAARAFHVSLPALIVRLSSVRVGVASSPRILLYSRFAENRTTQCDAGLRIEASSQVGLGDKWWVWPNRTVAGLRLQSAIALFESWRTCLAAKAERGGRYSWHPTTGLARLDAMAPSRPFDEQLVVTTRLGSRWPKVLLRARVASRLYARAGATLRDGYVISIVEPLE